jgi:hypothetical protein
LFSFSFQGLLCKILDILINSACLDKYEPPNMQQNLRSACLMSDVSGESPIRVEQATKHILSACLVLLSSCDILSGWLESCHVLYMIDMRGLCDIYEMDMLHISSMLQLNLCKNKQWWDTTCFVMAHLYHGILVLTYKF